MPNWCLSLIPVNEHKHLTFYFAYLCINMPLDMSQSCLSLDLPRIEMARSSSVQAYRLAKENQRKIFDDTVCERPKSRYETATRGYSGYIPKITEADGPQISSPTRYKIRGYTGHIPGSESVCGRPILSSEEVQQYQSSPSQKPRPGHHRIPVCKFTSRIVSVRDSNISIHGERISPEHRDFLQRYYGGRSALMKRYQDAVDALASRKQTRRGLLSIVQSKLSERVRSYAQQAIRVRKSFEYFDFDDNQILDEWEFREFLEMNNCYLDEVQRIALFSYFDKDLSGGLSWGQFSEHAMVPNPKGGTAILPKAIIRNDEAPDIV